VASEAIKIADEIGLSDLLEQPELTDSTIRFVCSLRKQLFQEVSDPDGGLAEIETRLNRIYHFIGLERRNQAFDTPSRNVPGATPKKEVVASRPLPPVIPQFAPAFSTELGTSLTRGAINIWSNQTTPKTCFTFSELKAVVERLHTKDGKLKWVDRDVHRTTSGQTHWEQVLQQSLVQLRGVGEVVYRSVRGDYYIVPA